ncbi:molybdate ABC transporter substrate-binding protein [Roseivivax isoporae]|uniref:Molybdenum ABC transporter substrate-binding protein n=1 Tax=Roseivivax isoporae LMG 25204 TaxID=1449351 RepID=X7F7L6_9RHOB|nr:substrate-binding domain-containing protein [Roseivivax isoporae]ETX28061.1 molybdenum ABC transporter substrate-binding protein [Roseivivax isoporae LMG 25204]
MTLRILSGGAANGLVNKVREAFEARTGRTIEGDFGAVGGMRDRIAGGEAVDLAILTRAAIDGLVAAGHLDAGSVTDLGNVVTGVAVRDGAPVPPIDDGEALATLFTSADALYCPDTVKATAGIHVAAVLDRLGIADRVTLSEHPNGQTAMARMAASEEANPVGCTQVTEILNTAGVTYVGPLPEPFGLDTVYTAAIATGSAAAEDARVLIELLTDPDADALRRSVGFS